MKPRISILLLLFVALLCAPGGYAQKKTKESLQKQINALQKEIETANKLLKETSKNKEVTLNQVTILDKKIQNRQELINAYNEQIKILDKNIRQGESNITKLNGELKKLRGELSKMVQFAYRNRSHYDRLEFFFAAEDFNQATRRMRYIQQFTDARKTKMNQIASTQKKVKDEVEANRKAREEQAALLAEEKAQQEALKKEKTLESVLEEIGVEMKALGEPEKCGAEIKSGNAVLFLEAARRNLISMGVDVPEIRLELVENPMIQCARETE